MMKQEFEKLTGIFPSNDLYRVIERRYMEFDGDKKDFCEAYMKNRDGLAESIQRETDRKNDEVQELFRHRQQAADKEFEQMKDRIKELTLELEKEQEWKPYECSQMKDEEYLKLKQAGGTEELSDQTARERIGQEFGFRIDLIHIHRTIPKYEWNRHNRIRRNGERDRPPVYNATDWNYCRFDVSGWKYEVINGQLYQYSD